MSAPVIEWVRRGETIQAPSLLDVEGTEPYMVLSPSPPDLLNFWFCETCRSALANVAQVEMHVEHGGQHRIAIWNSRRRCYEEAAPIALQTGAGL